MSSDALEQIDDVVDDVQESTIDPETPEAKAMAKGWRPLEEFKGDPDRWIGAKEFLARQPLFDKIDEKNQEIAALKASVDAVMSMVESQYEAGYKKAREELLDAQAEALEENDLTTYVEVSEKLTELDKDHTKKKTVAKVEDKPKQVVEPPKEFMEWTESNIWYTENEVMQKHADSVAAKIKDEFVDDLDGLLKEITRQVQKKFPSSRYFNSTKARPVASVESGNRMQSGKSKTYTREDLNPTEQRIMDNMLRTMAKGKDGKPLLSEAEYIQQVVSKRNSKKS